MKRFRLSTLMLLIVIASLVFALVVQQRRAARLQAELTAQLRLADEQLLNTYVKLQQEIAASRQRSTELMRLYRELELMKEGHFLPLESSSVGSLRRARIFSADHAAVRIAAGIP